MLESRNMVQEKSLCLISWNCHVGQLLRKEHKEMFSGLVGNAQAGLWDGRKLGSVARSSRTVAENTVICIRIVRTLWKQEVPHQGFENRDVFVFLGCLEFSRQVLVFLLRGEDRDATEGITCHWWSCSLTWLFLMAHLCADNDLGLHDIASNQSHYHFPLGTGIKGWCWRN